MKHIRSVSWLGELMQQQAEQYIIFDCRYNLMDEDAGELAYREGHIPGSYYAHLSLDLSSAKLPNGVGGRHPLPKPDAFAQFLSARGVSSQSTIIAYDEEAGDKASRLMWLLKWVGHSGHIYIIEGGFKDWASQGYRIEKTIPSLAYGPPYEIKLQPSILVEHTTVEQCLSDGGTIIIDSREGARYRGEVEPLDKKAGHIPTALNYVWTGNKDENGKWKDAAALQARFSELDKSKDIIVYCGSGVTATPNVFALLEAGFQNVKLYAGSWSEWSSLPNKPIAIGDK